MVKLPAVLRHPPLWLLTTLLALACGWLYLFGHDRYGLFDVDEAVFTQATREMLTEGTVAMPTYNAEPRYHKPPLIYWLQAASMQVFGEDSLWAARLPSALAAVGTVLLLGIGVSRFTKNPAWGLAAAAIMATNLSFVVIGRAATADALLNFFSLALVFSILRQLYPPKGQPWEWGPWASGGLLALGLLAKGPVAAVPAAAVVLTLLSGRTQRAVLWQRLAPFWVVAAAAAGLLPWLLLMVHQQGFAFFYEFIVVHNLQRYAGGFSNSHSASVLYYLPVLLLGLAPWILFLPQALPWALSDWRKRLASTKPEVVLPLLAVAWAVVVIGFFSFSSTRLAHYILPAYPALAILIGGWLVNAKRRSEWPTLATLGACWLGLLGVALISLPWLLEGLRQPVLTGFLGWVQSLVGFGWPPEDVFLRAALAREVAVSIGLPLAGMMVLLAVVPLYVLLAQGRKALVALALAWAGVLGLLVWGIGPTVWGFSQAPLAEMAAEIRAAPPGVPVVHLGVHKPSVLYLSQRKFLKLERPLQLPGYLTEPRTLVLTEEPTVPGIRAELALLRPLPEVTVMRCSGGYCLLSVSRRMPIVQAPAVDTTVPPPQNSLPSVLSTLPQAQ